MQNCDYKKKVQIYAEMVSLLTWISFPSLSERSLTLVKTDFKMAEVES